MKNISYRFICYGFQFSRFYYNENDIERNSSKGFDRIIQFFKFKVIFVHFTCSESIDFLNENESSQVCANFNREESMTSLMESAFVEFDLFFINWNTILKVSVLPSTVKIWRRLFVGKGIAG